MALNDTNERKIAYKKLVGKSHINQNFGAENEPIASFPQMASSQVFGESIPLTPQGSNVVTEVTFALEVIDESKYASDGRNTAEAHGFRLLKDGDRFGGQIVPESFGTVYKPLLKDDNGAPVSAISDYNWSLDCAAGVLWFQNLPTSKSLPNVSWTITAYEYTGRYLDEVVGTGGGGSGGGGVRTLNDTYDSDAQLSIGTDDLFLIDATIKPVKVELPPASANDKKRIVFKRIDDGSFTVYLMGAKTKDVNNAVTQIEYIDDIGTDTTVEGSDAPEWLPGDTQALYLYVKNETISLYCDGTKWHIT